MIAEQLSRQAPPRPHLVEEAATEVRQVLARDAELLGDLRTTRLNILVKAVIGDTDEAKVDQGRPVPGIDGNVIQQRSFLPDADALEQLIGNPTIMLLRRIGIVVFTHPHFPQKLHRALNRNRALTCQNLHQMAAHAIIAAGEKDESRLMGRILAAVAKDQEALLAIMTGPMRLASDSASTSPSPITFTAADVPSATGVTTFRLPAVPPQQRHCVRAGASVTRRG